MKSLFIATMLLAVLLLDLAVNNGVLGLEGGFRGSETNPKYVRISFGASSY